MASTNANDSNILMTTVRTDHSDEAEESKAFPELASQSEVVLLDVRNLQDVHPIGAASDAFDMTHYSS